MSEENQEKDYWIITKEVPCSPKLTSYLLNGNQESLRFLWSKRDEEPVTEKFDLKTWLDLQAMAVCFAPALLDFAEFGMVHMDMNPSNCWVTPDYKLSMIDFGLAENVDFPKDWEVVAYGFLSLLVNWNDDFIAAFRFGCIQHGGAVAELIFRKLRQHCGLHSFRDSEHLNYESPETIEIPSDEEIFNINKSWTELRETLPIGSLKTSNLEVKIIGDWGRFREEHGLERNPVADEYHYRAHLVASIKNGSFIGIIQSLVNLQLLYHQKNEHLKAAGFYTYCRYITEAFEYLVPNNETLELISGDLSFSKKLIDNYCSADILSLIDLIPLHPYKFPNNPTNCFRVFLYLWMLDDVIDGKLSLSN
jgi:hypothetical protein